MHECMHACMHAYIHAYITDINTYLLRHLGFLPCTVCVQRGFGVSALLRDAVWQDREHPLPLASNGAFTWGTRPENHVRIFFSNLVFFLASYAFKRSSDIFVAFWHNFESMLGPALAGGKLLRHHQPHLRWAMSLPSRVQAQKCQVAATLAAQASGNQAGGGQGQELPTVLK